jgi:hypothetical protein
MIASHRILQLNALSTAACAVSMLATRSVLPPLFGLESPMPLDILAVSLLAYAGALAVAAARQPVTRLALMAFTFGDTLWVVASAIVVILFWTELAPIARLLVIAAALVVEVFATLQYRAAGRVSTGARELA